MSLLLNKTKASEYLFGYKDTKKIDSLGLPTILKFGKIWYPKFILENYVKDETARQIKYKQQYKKN